MNRRFQNKTSALKLYLDRTLVKLQEELSNKHKEKLYTLYGGRLFIKQDRNTVINLSRVEISDAIHNIMKLGMNTHLKTRYDPHTTKIEIEKLYRSIKSIESDKRFGLRTHHDFSKDLLNKDAYKAVKDFCSNNEIVTRKADKSNTFVVLQKEDYFNKLDELIADQQNFHKISQDQTAEIKTQLNKIIGRINQETNLSLKKIYGHF